MQVRPRPSCSSPTISGITEVGPECCSAVGPSLRLGGFIEGTCGRKLGIGQQWAAWACQPHLPWAAAEALAELSNSLSSAPDPALSCLQYPRNILGSVEATIPALVQVSDGCRSPSLALMWVCFWACRKTWEPRLRVH